MTQEQIHEKLDNMYNSPTSKNFINHLIRSYIPATKIDKVWEKPKGKFRCVITNEPLSSIGEVIESLSNDVDKNNLVDSVKTLFGDNENTSIPTIKKLGFTGDKTDTFASYSAIKELYTWVGKKILSGDKHINWLMGQITGNPFSKKEEPREKIKREIKTVSSSNIQRATLGDLTQLKELHEKLLKEEKNQNK